MNQKTHKCEEGCFRGEDVQSTKLKEKMCSLGILEVRNLKAKAVNCLGKITQLGAELG